MGDTKLLPCPFCGETPIIYDREHHPKRDCWTVICNNDDCPACLVYADRDTEAEAIAAWNTRPALLAAAKYEEANPLGGPATMLEAAARRVRAGEDFHEVLADYALLARQEGDIRAFMAKWEWLILSRCRDEFESDLAALSWQRHGGEDAERFAWWFGQRAETSAQLIGMHIDSVNGKHPSLDEWRAAIDAARSGGGG